MTPYTRLINLCVSLEAARREKFERMLRQLLNIRGLYGGGSRERTSSLRSRARERRCGTAKPSNTNAYVVVSRVTVHLQDH